MSTSPIREADLLRDLRIHTTHRTAATGLRYFILDLTPKDQPVS